MEMLLPVGTSLLSWVHRAVGPGVVPGHWIPRHSSDMHGQHRSSAPNQHQIVAALRAADPGFTCAELDSMAAWAAADPDAARLVKAVRLVASDTEPGRWVAAVLEKLVPNRLPGNVETTVHAVAEMAATHGMQGGLRGFVHLLGELRRQAEDRGRRVVINATAGYKVESGLALLFGALTKSPVFYRHETMQGCVILPPVPIDWALDDADRRTLALVGGAADGELARDLGLGSRPHLWPFVEQMDDLWGLTALGEMVLATGAAAQVELENRAGGMKLDQKSSEKGHAPVHVPQVGSRIERELPFVSRARLVGWPRGRQGLLREHPGDQRHRRVRLAVGDGPHEGTCLHWLLDTTARTSEEWHEARRLTGEAFGRVPLEDELDAEEGSDLSDAPAGMAKLALEEKLRRRLLAEERRRKEAEDEKTERARAAERNELRLQRQAEEHAAQAKTLRVEKEALEKRVSSLTEDLEQAREEIRSLRTPRDESSEGGHH